MITLFFFNLHHLLGTDYNTNFGFVKIYFLCYNVGMDTILRPYQTQAISMIKEAWFVRGHRRVLLHMPTGAGKTVIFSYILKHSTVPALMVVRGRQLVDQASRRLFREDTDHGVMMAGHWNSKPSSRIQIASIDTLISRGLKPEAKIIVIDEAHLATSAGYAKFLAQYGPDTVVLHVTASPWNPDGLDVDAVVKPISMLDLIEQGYLVPPRYFCPGSPNLKGVKMQGDDYNQIQLAKAIDKGDLIGDIVKHWLARPRRPTLCFAVNVAHSKHIVAGFEAAGVKACHIDADTPDEVREAAYEGLRTGEIDIVSNVGIASVGVDVPWVGCLILARPTQSYNLYIQQCGRGTRNYEGKEEFVILDHAANVLRHGFITDEPEPVIGRGLNKKVTGGTKISQCPKCFAVFKAGTECPDCGYKGAPTVKVEKDGTLREVKALTEEEEYLVYLKRERALRRKPDGTKYKSGWVYFRFKEKFGEEVAKRYFKPRVVPEWIRMRIQN